MLNYQLTLWYQIILTYRRVENEFFVILYSLWWLCWNKYEEAKKCWNWPLRKICNITDAHTQGRRKHQHILAYCLLSLHFVSKVKFCGVTDIVTWWARGAECQTHHDTSSLGGSTWEESLVHMHFRLLNAYLNKHFLVWVIFELWKKLLDYQSIPQ